MDEEKPGEERRKVSGYQASRPDFPAGADSMQIHRPVRDGGD